MGKKITFTNFAKMKKEQQKIVMITAYDYASATLAQKAGVDIILVGDSLGNVVLGYDSTLPVTMEDMIHHTKPVVRGADQTTVITDMPFGSIEISTEQCVANAIRIIKETGCDGVKIEGGQERAHLIKAVSEAGIPVCGHIGLTPQFVMQFGGFKIQGKTKEAAEKLINDAIALEKAGAKMIVIECVPAEIAKLITEKISIPTIGIGAGAQCDGQVLVWYDLVNIYDGFKPKFVKRFAEAGKLIQQAYEEYAQEVRNGQFPTPEHTFATKMSDDELKKLY
jgi:3-methyl-2-oxobutanoate hydroxymethyltransferase